MWIPPLDNESCHLSYINVMMKCPVSWILKIEENVVHCSGLVCFKVY